ncbi:hypothetical protein UlMin_018287 [Ulmus minor]
MLAIFNKELVKPPQELKSPALSSTKNYFISSYSNNAFSMSYGNRALIAYAPLENHFSINQRQYGLSNGSNEAMLVIEAYQTLCDRSPFTVDQVLRELDGSFAFVWSEPILGNKNSGSVVIFENLEVIKTRYKMLFSIFKTLKMWSALVEVQDEGQGVADILLDNQECN